MDALTSYSAIAGTPIAFPTLPEAPQPPAAATPSPWDEAYLLHLLHEDLFVQAEWLPQLRDIAATGKRLNKLVASRHDGVQFHQWVLDIATQLQQLKLKCGLHYFISGSSVNQCLGREWLEALVSTLEQKTGRHHPDLLRWIASRTFQRNDIDARLEVTEGVTQMTTTEIGQLFAGKPGHSVTHIGNIAILVCFGDWDLFIRLKPGRNHVFDADSGTIRIPFDLKTFKPTLFVNHATGFVRGLLFGLADMSDEQGLNDHAWRVFLYKSICGWRLVQSRQKTLIFQQCLRVNGEQLSGQLDRSFDGHAMPPGSHQRHLFLIQLLCDQPDRRDWHPPTLLKHLAPQPTIWSSTLSLREPRAMQGLLVWLGCVALRERWTYPFRVSLAARAEKLSMRFDTDGKTLWIEVDSKALAAAAAEASTVWTWLQAVPWSNIERADPSFVYDSELKAVLGQILPDLPSDTPLQRFLQFRAQAPVDLPLCWRSAVHAADAWECEILIQCLARPGTDPLIEEMLPHASDYALVKAIKHRMNRTPGRLNPVWLQDNVWQQLIQCGQGDLLFRWILYIGLPGWNAISDPMRSKVLKYLTGGSLSVASEIALLDMTQSPLKAWEPLFARNDLQDQAENLLRCCVKFLPDLAKPLHRLATSILQKKGTPPAALQLLDHWIAAGNVTLALELWNHCRRSGLLQQWHESWTLLLKCGGRAGPDLQALATHCSEVPCSDPVAWAAVAKQIVPHLTGNLLQQKLLRVALQGKDGSLLPDFLLTNPTHTEALELMERCGRTQDWPYVSDLLLRTPPEGVDPVWIMRTWNALLAAKASSVPESLVQAITKLPTLPPDLLRAIVSAGNASLLGVDNNLQLLVKALADAANTDVRSCLFAMWDRSVKSQCLKYTRIPRQQLVNLACALSEESEEVRGRLLELLYASKDYLDTPAHLICDLTTSRVSSKYLAVPEMRNWLELWIEGIGKREPLPRAKGIGKMMSAAMASESFGRHTQSLEMAAAALQPIGDCLGRGGTAAALVLMQELSPLTNEEMPVAVVFSETKLFPDFIRVIFNLVPRALRRDDPAALPLILRAATACHLVTVRNESSRGRLGRYIFGVSILSYLQVRRDFVQPVSQWIASLKWTDKEVPDELTQACLLVNGSSGPIHFKDPLQLIRCSIQLASWAATVTDTFPVAANWFSLFLEDIAKTLGSDELNEILTRLMMATADFFLHVHPDGRGGHTPDPGLARCRRMVRAWGLLPWTDVCPVVGRIIWQRLKLLNGEDFNKVFLLALWLHRKECEDLVAEVEATLPKPLDVHARQYHINWRITHKERSDELDRTDPLLRGIKVSGKIATLGCAVMGTGGVVALATQRLGGSTPVVTLISSNSMKAGMWMVGGGSVGMTLCTIVFLVVCVARAIFPK